MPDWARLLKEPQYELGSSHPSCSRGSRRHAGYGGVVMTINPRRAWAALRRQGPFPDWTVFAPVVRRILALLICTTLAFVVAFLASRAFGQDRGTWFKALRSPATGQSCCDLADCKRTEADWKGEGWVAHYPDGEPVQVPNAIILDKPSIDGFAYLCASKSKRLYCFIKPDFGS